MGDVQLTVPVRQRPPDFPETHLRHPDNHFLLLLRTRDVVVKRRWRHVGGGAVLWRHNGVGAVERFALQEDFFEASGKKRGVVKNKKL